jgi:hypothetical protein
MPKSQGKYREFHRLEAQERMERTKKGFISMALRPIPYASEQGIFASWQGI